MKSFSIEELKVVSGLLSNGDGLLDIHTQNINGVLQSINIGSNSHTNTGSYLFFLSGTNSLIGRDLILRIRAGSYMQTVFPRVYTHDNQYVIGSGTSDSAREPWVLNSPIRIVGSGLGDSTICSGISFTYY